MAERNVEELRPAGIRASSAYSPELESLRGWAMLLVFAFHAEVQVSDVERVGTLVSPVFAFLTAGHTGVTLFFVLSAFLLSRPFLEQGRLGEERTGRVVRITDFFRRRVLRIMPLYAAAVATAVFFCFDTPGVLIEGLRALFFVNSFTGETVLHHTLMPYSAVWWSLGTEAQFYLALPFLGLCLRSRRGKILGLLVLIGWAVSYAIVTSDRPLMMTEDGFRFSIALPGRAPAFLAGIAAAWIVSRYGERIRRFARDSFWLRRGGSDLLLLSTLLALGFVLRHVTFLGFLTAERRWPIWHLAESGLWGFVLLIVVLMPIRSHALISNRLLALFGLLSYSLYLVHVPIVLGVVEFLSAHDVAYDAGWPARIATILGIFTLCLALSAFTYRFIERPFLLRKARIES
jgi:peptidoglycan/LPS O-acetylase OafA/YrhL